MKRLTVLLSTGGHLACDLTEEQALTLELRLVEGRPFMLGMPSSDGTIDPAHLVYVNVTYHVVRLDIEEKA